APLTANRCKMAGLNGAPEEIRTPDPQIRSLEWPLKLLEFVTVRTAFLTENHRRGLLLRRILPLPNKTSRARLSPVWLQKHVLQSSAGTSSAPLRFIIVVNRRRRVPPPAPSKRPPVRSLVLALKQRALVKAGVHQTQLRSSYCRRGSLGCIVFSNDF